MIRLVLLIALLCSPCHAQVGYWRGRAYSPSSFPRAEWCNCRMCQSLRAQWATPVTSVTSTTASTVSVLEKPTQYTTITEYVPVTTRVKRCNGRQCWYENVTTYKAVTKQVPIHTPEEPGTLTNDELVPTPHEAVVHFVKLAKTDPSEVLYDLGSGDGRILIAATTTYGCRSVGIELNPKTVELSKLALDVFNLQDKIRVYEGDILKYNLKQADVVTLYLYPDLIEKILPLLPSGCRVVSYMHPLPDSEEHQFGEHFFYTWTKP